VFGAILLYAAWRALRDDPAEEKDNRAVIWLAKHLPITHVSHNASFITRENGRLVATPLLIALVAIELTDIVFAVDSVPPPRSAATFIVYTSNAFAILGLRALYTVLAQTLRDMHYLHYGLAGVLAFAAIKLMIADFIEIPPPLSIGLIAAMIGASVWASLRARKRARGTKGPSDRDRTAAWPAG
jgi:tellurite resistance protein TerC